MDAPDPAIHASEPFHITQADDLPIVAAALHDGSALRADVAAAIALTDAERRREEDPHTARWTHVVGTRIIARRSRFEVDLNRPREQSVYRRPEDAWGLRVWRGEPPDEMIERSLAIHDAFYAAVHSTLTKVRERWGRFVVLDLHSYNHRRGGPQAAADDPGANPEVNVGTGSMDHARWRGVVDRFIDDLRAADYLGRSLDVRENVRFRGGHFAAWVHGAFPGSGCALAIEVKKFFMDEWTGTPDPVQLEGIGGVLAGTLGGIHEELERMS